MGAKVIETIGTLPELKAYCCPRVAHIKEWYLKCVDCKQQKDCTTGTRAVALLNQQTRPKTERERIIELNQQRAELSRQKARADFEEAMKCSDPVAWVMENRGSNRSAAKQRIYTWREKYPDIYEKYAGIKKTTGNKKPVEGYERARIVFAQEDPIKYLLENGCNGRHSAQNRIYKYMHKYPDLVEEFKIREWYEANKGKAGRKPKKEEENMVAVKSMRPETDTDEVSVEEFLAEQNNAPKEPEKPVKVQVTPYSKLSKEDILLEAVKAKRQEILNVIKGLERDIALEKEKLSTLTKTMAILTGDIFPENPV